MWIAILSAFLCIVTRALLNVYDRIIFKKDETDFLKSMVYNAVFPFLVAAIVEWLLGNGHHYFREFILEPGVILSALGAQVAAYIFSYAFKKMDVRNVVVSTKIADLFIPSAIFYITNRFNPDQYFFSLFTTFLFIPIVISAIKNRVSFRPLVAFEILAILCIQAGINSYFYMSSFGDTWEKFLSLMTCILLWRAIFTLFPPFLTWLKNLPSSDRRQKKHVAYFQLFIRAILSFICQVFFFYSITRQSGGYAWPILNSSPLVACFAAQLLIGERMRNIEAWVLGLGAIVVSSWGILDLISIL